RSRCAEERLGAAGHDTDPDLARRERRGAARAARGRGEGGAALTPQGQVSPDLQAAAAVYGPAAGRAGDPPAPGLEHVLRQARLRREPCRDRRQCQEQFDVRIDHRESSVVLLRACGCAWKYNSRRRLSVTWV